MAGGMTDMTVVLKPLVFLERGKAASYKSSINYLITVETWEVSRGVQKNL